MKQKKLKLCALLFFALSGLQAQEAITTSGGNASGSGGTVSYTVGQVVYTTNTGTNGTMAQGVQQPYEILVVSGIEQTKGINLECMVYPNPTIDLLTLKVENYNHEKLSYQLFDINGKALKNEKLTDNETTISMTDFVPAIYFLKVTDNQKEVKAFKIIKN